MSPLLRKKDSRLARRDACGVGTGQDSPGREVGCLPNITKKGNPKVTFVSGERGIRARPEGTLSQSGATERTPAVG